jgi:hypothetical protein
MQRCLAIWTDPTGSKEARLGPYMCGRQVQHKGSHARQGNDGSFAAWTQDGELLLASQVVYDGPVAP